EPGDPPAVVDRLAAIDHVVDAAFPPRLDALAVQAREIDERRVRLDRPADLDRVREQRPRRPAARRYLHAVLLVVRADLEARGRRARSEHAGARVPRTGATRPPPRPRGRAPVPATAYARATRGTRPPAARPGPTDAARPARAVARAGGWACGAGAF